MRLHATFVTVAQTLVLSTLLACREELPPVGHYVVFLDTDAPLRPSSGAAYDPIRAPALFDRIRVDVYRLGKSEPCDGCSREFDATEDRFRAGASFTVVPPSPGERVRVRTRLFLTSRISSAIVPESAVDVWTELPPVREGSVEVNVFLPTDSVGQPMGSAEVPLEPTLGPAPSSRVGTWSPAVRIPCPGEPEPHEVCIPGGAYWMGNPLVHADALTISDHRRLVVLSPFYMDDHEVTVAELRASTAKPTTGALWSGNDVGDIVDDYCRYTAEKGPFEDLPVNCLTWESARAHCVARGADLPTEAEFEYVAGALESRLYAWGVDEPTCDDAVFGRGGIGRFQNYPSSCLADARSTDPTTIGGPLALPIAPTTGAQRFRKRAHVELPGGTLRDIVGNLGEWTLDTFARQDEPCWSEPRVYTNPVCTTRSSSTPNMDVRSVRGGGWLSDGVALRAAARDAQIADSNHVQTFVGFRCVRHAPP